MNEPTTHTTGTIPGDTTTHDTSPDVNRGNSAVSGNNAARRLNFGPLVVAVLLFGLSGLGMYWFWQNHLDEKSALETPKGNASSKAALATAKRAPGDENSRRLGADGDSSGIEELTPQTLPSKKQIVPAIERDHNANPIPVQSQVQGQGINQGPQSAPRSRFDAPTSFNTGYGSSTINAAGLPGVSVRQASTLPPGRTDYSVSPPQPFTTPTPFDKSALNLSTTRTPAAIASMIGNRDFILAKGAFIDCDLDTAINSTVPGMVRCTTTKDAYSDNGRVVLVGRGSTVTGEYRSDVQNGQARIQIIWNRIKTPEGAVIEPASPASDNLGRGGVDGDVDNHWGERVGAAFLLSMIKDAIAYKTATNGTGTTTNLAYQNTTQSGEQMSSLILKQTINIPPTITRNQGTRVKIFLARDLDFSGVYTLKVAP